MGDRGRAIQFAIIDVEDLPLTVSRLAKFLKKGKSEDATANSEVITILKYGNLENLSQDEINILSISLFEEGSGLIRAIYGAKDNRDAFIISCRKTGLELISTLIRIYGRRIIGSSYQTLLNDLVNLYQLDASIDVQAVVVSLIEVIVESEKKFREGKDLADFVEIVSSVLSSIIRDYKQRRKKIGISLGAAILIVIGRLLRHLPQLTQSNPLFINDIATFCFSTLKEQMTRVPPQYKLVEGILISLDSVLFSFPQQIFDECPPIGDTSAHLLLFNAVAVISEEHADVSRNSPRIAALTLLKNHSQLLKDEILKHLEHTQSVIEFKAEKSLGDKKSKSQSEGLLGSLFDAALSSKKEIQSLGSSALSSVIQNVLVNTLLEDAADIEVKASALTHLQCVRRDAKRIVSQWREKLDDGLSSSELDFKRAVLGLHLLSDTSRGLVNAGADELNRILLDASELLEIIEISVSLPVGVASRFFPNVCDAISLMILNTFNINQSFDVPPLIPTSLPSLLKRLAGYYLVAYTSYRRKLTWSFCHLLEAMIAISRPAKEDHPLKEWQYQCRKDCETAIDSVLLSALFAYSDDTPGSALVMKSFLRQIFLELDRWVHRSGKRQERQLEAQSIRKRKHHEISDEGDARITVHSNDQQFSDGDGDEFEEFEPTTECEESNDDAENDQDQSAKNSNWYLNHYGSSEIVIETFQWLSNTFLKSCHCTFTLTSTNQKTVETKQHRGVQQITTSTLIATTTSDILKAPNTIIKQTDELSNLLSMHLLNSAVTIQEALINADAVNRLASILEHISPFMSQTAVSKWFCQFIQTSLKVLSQGTPFPSLFSFIRSLSMQGHLASQQLEKSKPPSDNDSRVESTVSRKRARRSVPVQGSMDEEIPSDYCPVQLTGFAPAVTLLTKFCLEVSSRLFQYTDELRFNALLLLLNVPDHCVASQSLLTAVHLALEHGVSHPHLAFAGIKILERWQKKGDPDALSLLTSTFPLLSPYLAFQEQKNIDENKLDLTGARTRSRIHRERKEQFRLKNRSFGDLKLQREIQLKVLRLLGSSGSRIFDCLDSPANLNRMKCQALARPSELDLSIQVDVTLNNVSSRFQFGDVTERVAWLSENGPNRQIRVSAMESLHAFVEVVVGKLATFQDRNQQTRQINIFCRYAPLLLRLASGMDPIGQQLFEPFLFNVIHWIGQQSILCNFLDLTEFIIPELFLAMSSSTHGELRDIGGRLFVELIKQMLETQLENSTAQMFDLTLSSFSLDGEKKSVTISRSPSFSQPLYQLLDSIGHPNSHGSKSAMKSTALLLPLLGQKQGLLLDVLLHILPQLLQASATMMSIEQESKSLTNVSVQLNPEFENLFSLSIESLEHLLNQLNYSNDQMADIEIEGFSATRRSSISAERRVLFHQLLATLWEASVGNENESRCFIARSILVKILNFSITVGTLSDILGIDVYHQGREYIRQFNLASLSTDEENIFWISQFTELWTPMWTNLLKQRCSSEGSKLSVELVNLLLNRFNDSQVKLLLTDINCYKSVLLNLTNRLLQPKQTKDQSYSSNDATVIDKLRLINFIQFGMQTFGTTLNLTKFWNRWFDKTPLISSFIPFGGTDGLSIISKLNSTQVSLISLLESLTFIVTRQTELHLPRDGETSDEENILRVVVDLLNRSRLFSTDTDGGESKKEFLLQLSCLWFKKAVELLDSKYHEKTLISSASMQLLSNAFWSILGSLTESISLSGVEMFCSCFITENISSKYVSLNLINNLLENQFDPSILNIADDLIFKINRLSELITFLIQQLQDDYVQYDDFITIIIQLLLPLLMTLLTSLAQFSISHSSSCSNEASSLTALRSAGGVIELGSLNNRISTSLLRKDEQIFKYLSTTIVAYLSLDMPLDVHRITLSSLCSSFFRFLLHSFLNPQSDEAIVNLLRSESLRLYNLISHQLLSRYFPLKSTDILKSSKDFVNFKTILTALCNASIYSIILPSPSPQSHPQYLTNSLTSVDNPLFLWTLIIPSLTETHHALFESILKPSIQCLITAATSDHRVCYTFGLTLLSMILPSVPSYQREGFISLNSNHFQFDSSSLELITEYITLPLLWECKPDDLLTILGQFWPAISSCLTLGAEPNFGVSSTVLSPKTMIEERLLILTLIFGIVEILFSRIPEEALRDDQIGKSLFKTSEQTSTDFKSVIKFIIPKLKILRNPNITAIVLPNDQYLRKYHLRSFGCFVAVIGSTQDKLLLYSKYLLDQVNWSLLTPFYSLDDFPNRRPFTIDTNFDTIIRSSISLQYPNKKKGKKSSFVLGVRDFIVSSGEREMSLVPSMLASSSTLLKTRSQTNPVAIATRRRAVGTLKTMLSTQQGSTLIRQSQVALTQLATMQVTENSAAAVERSVSQDRLKSLLSQLAEAASIDQSINSQLWEGWTINDQIFEPSIHTKRIQGALLGRRNRIIDSESSIVSNDVNVLMWDNELLENDFINKWPILSLLLKLLDILQERFIDPLSTSSISNNLSIILNHILESLLPEHHHFDQQSSPLRLLALRIIQLRWELFGSLNSSRLVERIVKACLADPAIQSNIFHYFLRDVCEVLVAWGIKPASELESQSFSEFVQVLIRICADERRLWRRLHLNLIEKLMRLWMPSLRLDIQRIGLSKRLNAPISAVVHRIVGIGIARTLANAGIDPSGEPSQEQLKTGLGQTLRAEAERFYQGIIDCLSFGSKEVVVDAAETLGIILSQFLNSSLEFAVQLKLESQIEHDATSSKAVARSQYKGTQLRTTVTVEALQRLTCFYPWILIGSTAEPSRRLFNIFINAFLQCSTAESGGYDAERRVVLLNVLVSILALREIPEKLKRLQRFSNNETDNDAVHLQNLREQQDEILKALAPLWNSLFRSIDADVCRPSAIALRHGIELMGSQLFLDPLRTLNEIIKQNYRTSSLFKETYFDICLYLFMNEGYQTNPEILSFLMIDDLEVLGQSKATQRLLEKRHEFFSTHSSLIGLTNHPSSSLINFISLLFPTFHKKSSTSSFVHIICNFFLDSLKRESGFCTRLFPPPHAVSERLLPSVPIETTLRSSTSAIRSTLSHPGTLALLCAAAETASRTSTTLGIQGTQQPISSLSLQHPFIQTLCQRSEPVIKSAGKKSTNEYEEKGTLKFERHNTQQAAARDQAMQVAEHKKKAAHREYEKWTDFRNRAATIVRKYRHAIPDTELNRFDIFEPISHLIGKDEELSLYVLICLVKAFFIESTNSNISDLIQLLLYCFQFSILSTIPDSLLIRFCFSCIMIVPLSLSKALNDSPMDLSSNWDIIPFNQYGIQTSIKTVASIVLTLSIFSNEWYGGVYVLEQLLGIYRKLKAGIPITDHSSSKGDHVSLDEQITKDDYDNIDSFLLGSLYQLFNLLESHWSLEALMQFFPNTIVEIWDTMKISRRDALKMIESFVLLSSQSYPISLEKILQSSGTSSSTVDSVNINVTLLHGMKLEAMQSLYEWSNLSELLKDALDIERWESAESQAMIRSVYHRHMEKENVDIEEKESLKSLTRRLLHRKSTAISDEESIGRIWGIEAWTPEQHNERQVLNIRRSPGLIAAATLCVLNDAVKARHLCFEAYEEILDQLRSIPPLAEECRRSILGTIPLIRESEALANTETHSGQLWINPNYLIEHIPSIRHVLSNELINEIIEGKINKKEIQLWQTQHFESNDLCYFDPIMISDLCTIRLRAIINLVEKVYLDNVQVQSNILSEIAPCAFIQAANGLMNLNEYESAEEMIKYGLRCSKLPCIQRTHLIDDTMSFSSFKAVIRLRLHQAKISKNLSKVENLRRNVVARQADSCRNESLVVRTECQLLHIACLELESELKNETIKVNGQDVALDQLTKLTESLLEELKTLENGNGQRSILSKQRNTVLLQILDHIDREFDRNDNIDDALRQRFCEIVIEILSTSFDYNSEAFQTAHLHLPRLFELIPMIQNQTEQFKYQLQTLPSWTFLRWINQLLAWIGKEEEGNGRLYSLFAGPLTKLVQEYPEIMFYSLLAAHEANISSALSTLNPGISLTLSLLRECETFSPLAAEFAVATEMLVSPEIRLRDFYLDPIHRLARHARQNLETLPTSDGVPPAATIKAKSRQNPFASRPTKEATGSRRSSVTSSPSGETIWEKDIRRRWCEMWRTCLSVRTSIASSIPGDSSDVVRSGFIGRDHRIAADNWIKIVKEVFNFGKGKMTHQEMCEKSLLQILSNPELLTTLKNLTGSKEQSKESTLRLQDFSLWFNKFNSLPQQRRKQHPQCLNTLLWPFFELNRSAPPNLSEITTFTSKQKPRRLKIVLDDLSIQSILVKGGDDLRLDQRMCQLFGLINQLIQKSHQRSVRSSTIRTFRVIPLKNQLGLISWISNSISLKTFIENKALGSPLFSHPSRKTFVAGLNLPTTKNLVEGYERVLQGVPETIVRNLEQSVDKLPDNEVGGIMTSAIRRSSPSIEIFARLKKNFLISLGSFNAVSWIFGIGDRHPDNFLLDINTFEIIGIDFGYSFGFATTMLPIPELLPFRFTPSLWQVSQPVGGPLGRGDFSESLTTILKICCDAERNISAIASVFINAPLVDTSWIVEALSRHTQFICDNSESIVDINQSVPSFSGSNELISDLSRRKLYTVKRKLIGMNPVQLLLSELEGCVRPCVAADVKNPKSHLYQAITGIATMRYRCSIQHQSLSPSEQALILCDMATDPNLLGRSFFGWSPYL